MNKVLTLLPVVVLTACGGGSSSSGNDTTGNNGAPRQSSSYPTEQLKVFFTLSGTSTKAAEVRGYIEDGNSHYVLLDGTDQLIINAGGEIKSLVTSEGAITEGSGLDNGLDYRAEVSALASEYVVTWQRDSIEIGSITVNELPFPFEPLVSFAGEVIDISWTPEADHSYHYIAEALHCKQGSETAMEVVSPDIISGEEKLNSGIYLKSLNDIFGKTQAELIEGYESCYFEMEIVGIDNNHHVLTSGNITLSIEQSRTVRVNL